MGKCYEYKQKSHASDISIKMIFWFVRSMIRYTGNNTICFLGANPYLPTWSSQGLRPSKPKLLQFAIPYVCQFDQNARTWEVSSPDSFRIHYVSILWRESTPDLLREDRPSKPTWTFFLLKQCRRNYFASVLFHLGYFGSSPRPIGLGRNGYRK